MCVIVVFVSSRAYVVVCVRMPCLFCCAACGLFSLCVSLCVFVLFVVRVFMVFVCLCELLLFPYVLIVVCVCLFFAHHVLCFFLLWSVSFGCAFFCRLIVLFVFIR